VKDLCNAFKRDAPMVTDRAIVVMVRCPTTGRELSTGIEMDVCGLDHLWSTRLIRHKIGFSMARLPHGAQLRH